MRKKFEENERGRANGKAHVISILVQAKRFLQTPIGFYDPTDCRVV